MIFITQNVYKYENYSIKHTNNAVTPQLYGKTSQNKVCQNTHCSPTNKKPSKDQSCITPAPSVGLPAACYFVYSF